MVAELVADCEEFEDGEREMTEADIRAFWSVPGLILAEASIAVFHGDRLAASGDVHDGYAEVDVRPRFRGRGLGSVILPWTWAQARAQGATRVSQTVSDARTDGAALFTANGYEARWTSWMLRMPLRGVQRPELPHGYEIGELDYAADARGSSVQGHDVGDTGLGARSRIFVHAAGAASPRSASTSLRSLDQTLAGCRHHHSPPCGQQLADVRGRALDVSLERRHRRRRARAPHRPASARPPPEAFGRMHPPPRSRTSSASTRRSRDPPPPRAARAGSRSLPTRCSTGLAAPAVAALQAASRNSRFVSSSVTARVTARPGRPGRSRNPGR